jgi:phospholipid/cholesterol/gamma-HCH transport system permease protein
MKLPKLKYGTKLNFSDKFFNFFATLSGIGIFVIEFFKQVFRPPYEIEETKRHMLDFGIKSLPIVGTMGIIIGFVLSLEGYAVLQPFGGTEFLPGSVGLSIVREFAPILTALLFAGRVAAGIGAELGSMRVTEQIDAMDVSGVEPFRYLVITRVIAATMILPLLTVYVIVISIFGGYVAVYLEDGMSFTYFVNTMLPYVHITDLIAGLSKTFLFGFAVGIVGSYKGYATEGGTVGVGKSTTSSVVISSLLILFIDMIMVKISLL